MLSLLKTETSNQKTLIHHSKKDFDFLDKSFYYMKSFNDFTKKGCIQANSLHYQEFLFKKLRDTKFNCYTSVSFVVNHPLLYV